MYLKHFNNPSFSPLMGHCDMMGPEESTTLMIKNYDSAKL